MMKKANLASIKTDLASAAQNLNLYHAKYGTYPTLDGNYCPASPSTVDANYCLKLSSGSNFVYNTTDHQTFLLTGTRGTHNYYITEITSPTIVSALTCPTGFIVVPGSATYGTSDFCVMKYEAKADDNGDGIGDTNQTTGYNTWPANTYPISATRKLVSSYAGYPVGRISQTTATTAASSYTANCDTGCHLMTNDEWMTIAQNVLSVPSNWTDAGGTIHEVGTGAIYIGHNDRVPDNALEADSSDANGYLGTGQSSPSSQRRTLTLTNGEVIWDFSGDVSEWIQGTINGNLQPGLVSDPTYNWRQWNNGSLVMNGLASSYQPISTGITDVSGWSSTQGIGQLYSNYGETVAHGIRRGGAWHSDPGAGVLCLILDSLSSDSSKNSIGFRVAK